MEPESLEDGEIIDDESIGGIGGYVVLERPQNYASTLVNPRFRVEEEESECELTSPSDSDSTDSDCTKPALKAKRAKYKIKPIVKHTTKQPKKYDIWSTRVQEEVLLENLVNCDVSNVDRSRNVETYPLPNFITNRCKRSFTDRYQSKLHTNTSESGDDNISASRKILDTHVTVDDSDVDVANDIANKLYETNEEIILTIVKVIGKERSLEFFKKTQSIEESGGMLVMNRTRRRTPGGIFLFLVKSNTYITPEQHQLIFQESKTSNKEAMRNRRKLKNKELKRKIAAAKNNCETNLPELLTKSELCVNLGVTDRTRRKSEVLDVKNPPPSPVTDVHENSSDDTDTIKQETKFLPSNPINVDFGRNIVNYDDDCITDDLNMELF